ncbi:YopX family protein [Clostridium sp. UBA4395]|uniref:YopX family protein n=1 Tax=Clostridium sp. UBA4395 TaxID=1946360 RepID=UPI0032174A18
MREIKFRGKRIDNGEWIYGDLWQCKYSDGRIKITISEQTPNALCNIEVIAETVGQYTGLNDKNNKEIYEGDIIEGGYLNPLTSEFLSRKYIIEYDKGSFKGKLIGHTPYGDTWLQFIDGEVIGNIYEDKHLLEG